MRKGPRRTAASDARAASMARHALWPMERLRTLRGTLPDGYTVVAQGLYLRGPAGSSIARTHRVNGGKGFTMIALCPELQNEDVSANTRIAVCLRAAERHRRVRQEPAAAVRSGAA